MRSPVVCTGVNVELTTPTELPRTDVTVCHVPLDSTCTSQSLRPYFAAGYFVEFNV